MNKKFLLLPMLLAGALLFSATAHALKVGPTIVEAALKPGESDVYAIRLTNDSNKTLTLTPDVYELEASDSEFGFPQIVPRSAESTLANWITLREPVLTLGPNESKDVNFTINVPKNAAPGGHYASLAWGAGASKPEGDSGSGLAGQVAANIALDVAGEAVNKASVVGFSTEGNTSKYEKLPITFVTRVSNLGNRHFRPQGTISIKDMFGRTVSVLPFNKVVSGGNVLPKSTREFKATWSDGFAFGKYTAVLNTSLGKAGTATAATAFWVLPTGLLVLWLVIAVVILIILIMLIRNMLTTMKK